MERDSALYIATAYSGQSGVAATQAQMDDLTTLYRALATEIVDNVPDGEFRDHSLVDLENSAKQAFHAMRYLE